MDVQADFGSGNMNFLQRHLLSMPGCYRCIGRSFRVVEFIWIYLTLTSLQTNTDTFADSADPDEMAHNEPSH